MDSAIGLTKIQLAKLLWSPTVLFLSWEAQPIDICNLYSIWRDCQMKSKWTILHIKARPTKIICS